MDDDASSRVGVERKRRARDGARVLATRAREAYETTFASCDRDAALALAERSMDRARVRGDEWFYGELEFDAARDALRRCAAARDGLTFVDLGSGVGKMCVAAALTGAYARARGVEILGELHAAASDAVERLEGAIDAALEAGAEGEDAEALRRAKACEVTVDLGDLLNFDVSDADVVYIHATCFTPELLLATATKLANEMKTGARVMLMSKQFPEGWVFKPFDGGYVALAQPQSQWKLDCFLYEIAR